MEARTSLADVCPLCNGSQYQFVKENEQIKGVKWCECKLRRIRREREKMIPLEFRKFRLESFRPMNNWQSKVLPRVVDDPFQTMLFAGRPSLGKSSLAWTVFREAIETNRFVWGGNLATWFDLMQRQITGEDFASPLVPSKLRSEEKWTVLLDEVCGERVDDGVKVSEFRSEIFHELIDAAYSFGQQIIACGNGSIELWEKKWGWRTIRRLQGVE